MVTIFLAVVTVICTMIAVTISYLAYRQSHSDRATSKRKEELTQAVVSGTSELSGKVSLLEDQFMRFRTDFSGNVQALVERALRPLDIQLAQVETKLAMAMAQILHQPDPARAEVDALLESFMEGTITPDDLSELRRHLDQIKNWEPGQASPYPIHPGEQVAAAILLNTMDTAMSARGKRGRERRG